MTFHPGRIKTGLLKEAYLDRIDPAVWATVVTRKVWCELCNQEIHSDGQSGLRPQFQHDVRHCYLLARWYAPWRVAPQTVEAWYMPVAGK